MGDILEALFREPLIVCITLLAIELGFVVLAILLTPWAARNEPVSHSFQHAFRRVWLHTGHVAVATLLIGSTFVITDHARDRHNQEIHQATRHLKYPQMPSNPTAQERVEIRKAQKDYYAQYQQISRSIPRPVLSRHDEEIVFYFGVAVSVWFVWALMRSLAVKRPSQKQAIDPLCRMCGYNLTGAQLEGRCPECGGSVYESIGPLPDDHAPSWGWRILSCRNFVRMVVESLGGCRRLAMRLRFESQETAYRWFFLLSLLLSGLVFYLLIIVTTAVAQGRFHFDLLILEGPVAAGIWVLFLLAGKLACALIVGIVIRFKEKRNVLALTCRLACYQSMDLVLVSLLFGVLIFVGEVFDHDLRVLMRGWGLRSTEWILSLYMIFFLVSGLAILFRLFRASRGVRYASR